jgi:ketosteroid isomerase-like protein
MDQVRQTLDAINQAWRERRFDALNEFFDENIVMRGPGLKEAARGREAAIQSYLQFMAQSNVIGYAESNHAVDMWGDIAVATCDWVITYEQKGQTKTDKGNDMFVFSRSGSRWLAVFRLILF